MITRNTLYLLALLSTLLWSCEKALISPDADSEPEKNFELFWSDVRNTYPFFDLDKVDWQATYNQYRPTVSSNTTRDQLFTTFTQMLTPLLDGHISLTDPIAGYNWNNPRHYIYDPNGNIDSVFYSFLYHPTAVNVQNTNTIAVHDFLGNKCLYLAVLTYDVNYKFDSLLNSLQKAHPNNRGLILDLRFNSGGYIQTMYTLMGMFTPVSLTYAYAKEKTGPLDDNFSNLAPYTVDPNPSYSYTKPVILLTSRYTFSAAEHSTLIGKQLSNIKVMGDYTGGALSIVIQRDLPNLMTYKMVNSILYDLDKTTTYEKVGIPPEEKVVMSQSDYNPYNDVVINQAFSEIP